MNGNNGIFAGLLGFFLLVLLTIGAMVGCPTYNVYHQRKAGEADGSSRQVRSEHRAC